MRHLEAKAPWTILLMSPTTLVFARDPGFMSNMDFASRFDNDDTTIEALMSPARRLWHIARGNIGAAEAMFRPVRHFPAALPFRREFGVNFRLKRMDWSWGTATLPLRQIGGRALK